MAVDFKLMYALETVLPTMLRHDKHDFDLVPIRNLMVVNMLRQSAKH